MSQSQDILTEDDSSPDLRLNYFTAGSYLSKYGFNDGESVLPAERPFCQQEANKLADRLREHLVDWEPCVMETGHNPYYVCFRNLSTGEFQSLHEMAEIERRKVNKAVDFVFLKDDSTPDFRLNSFTAGSYLNRYGFNDGEDVLPAERPICRQEANKLADRLREHLLDWEPCVMETGHNPYYVCFRNLSTGAFQSLYEMEESERRKIDRVVDFVFLKGDSSPDFRLSAFTVSSYLNRYGFNDGESVLPAERPFCQQEAHKLADRLRGHLVDWEPCVMETGHNPYFVGFRNLSTGRFESFYDMEESERRKIDKVVKSLKYTE